MILERSKLYLGCVDVRDSEIKEAKRKNENIVIVCKKKQMTITPAQFDKPKMISDPIRSKVYPDQFYKLLLFKFKPDENKEKRSVGKGNAENNNDISPLQGLLGF